LRNTYAVALILMFIAFSVFFPIVPSVAGAICPNRLQLCSLSGRETAVVSLSFYFSYVGGVFDQTGYQFRPSFGSILISF